MPGVLGRFEQVCTVPVGIPFGFIRRLHTGELPLNARSLLCRSDRLLHPALLICNPNLPATLLCSAKRRTACTVMISLARHVTLASKATH